MNEEVELNGVIGVHKGSDEQPFLRTKGTKQCNLNYCILSVLLKLCEYIHSNPLVALSPCQRLDINCIVLALYPEWGSTKLRETDLECDFECLGRVCAAGILLPLEHGIGHLLLGEHVPLQLTKHLKEGEAEGILL